MPPPEPILPRLDPARPFRIGATSYVYPADLLPNVERTAPVLDDIEVVLFQSREADNLPTPAVIEQLAELGRQHATTYTIHFPLDRKLGHADPAERARTVDALRHIVRLTAPLDPFAYIVHPEGVEPGADAPEVARWQRDADDTLARVLEDAPLPPGRFALENLATPYAWSEPLVDRHGLSVCIDIGHLRLYNVPVLAHVRRHLPRTRVIHLHGVREQTDHLALTVEPAGRLETLLAELKGFPGVVTLELFDFASVSASIDRVNTWIRTTA